MGIQKLEPEEGSEDKKMTTSQKLEPEEGSEDKKMSTSQTKMSTSPKLEPEEGSEDKKMSTSELEYMNQKKQTDMVVATLIATVTFTAGFTVPGGFKSGGVDEGMAALSKRTAFRVFLIANTLAFGLSITSVFIHFCSSTLSMEVVPRRKGIGITPIFTAYSTVALWVAFISGTYTVVPHSMGITTAVIICWCLIIYRYFYFIYKQACYQGFQWFIILYAPYMED